MTQRRIIPLRGSAPTEFKRMREQAGLTPGGSPAAAGGVGAHRSTGMRAASASHTRLAIRTLKTAISDRRNQSARPSGTTLSLYRPLRRHWWPAHHGFESVGRICVFTSEWDANAQKTYALY